MRKVVVIDDDRGVLRLVEKALSDMDADVHTASNAAAGIEAIRDCQPDIVLLDVMLPHTSGIEVVNEIRKLDARLPVILITASDDSSLAIEAMKRGAYEYVLKPLGIEQIQDLVERGFETRRLMQSPVHLNEPDESLDDGDALIGRSEAMLDVYKQIGRVAAQNVSVLIRGESGTGKELIARALYQHSDRTHECFLAVNCAALSETLLESELFGHEKGAFTGADQQRIGKFEQCDRGTIFLDEVGDMSPLTQSKVLRLLQEQEFERVGGRETISVDVRVISATNRDLEQMIEDGDFRLDLFHRLNAFEIQLPPLRERGSDITRLIEHFISMFNHELGSGIEGVSEESMELFSQYSWPGNIRELQGVLKKAMLLTTGPVLLPDSLSTLLDLRQAPEASDTTNDPATDLAQFIAKREAANSVDLYSESLEWMERIVLKHVLQRHAGNQSRAAEQLGITRGSLRHKIKSLGIVIEQVVNAENESSGAAAPNDADE